MAKITIVIDEAGTLPDPKDKVVIMAAVGTDARKILLNIVKRVRQKIRPKKKEKQISEIKFYRAGERTKLFYLRELSNSDIDVFVLVVEKDNQKIADSPENFALLSYILINECLLFYRDGKIREVVFDKHFHRERDLIKFNNVLLKLLGKELPLSHLESEENPEVNAADMIAGSLLWKHTGKNDKFYKIIKDKVISEKIINWKEARKIFFTKTKNLTNRRKRPSSEDS